MFFYVSREQVVTRVLNNLGVKSGFFFHSYYEIYFFRDWKRDFNSVVNGRCDNHRFNYLFIKYIDDSGRVVEGV